jgi:hypothetical protein
VSTGLDMSQKVGPLPMGGWVAAVVGGLGVGWYLRRRNAATAAQNFDPTGGTIAPTAADTGGTGGAGVSDPSYVGAGMNQPTSAELAGSPIPVDTNAQWRQQAVKSMVGRGFSAIAAENAVGRYLNGMPLTEVEAAQINATVSAIGPTPAAVPLTVITHPAAPAVHHPAPKPKPKPVHHPVHHVTHPTHHVHAAKTAPKAAGIRDHGKHMTPGR